MFLAVKVALIDSEGNPPEKSTGSFWLEQSGSRVAADLAGGTTTNRYWYINETPGGAVTLRPVKMNPSRAVSVQRVEIVSDGKVVGSSDI